MDMAARKKAVEDVIRNAGYEPTPGATSGQIYFKKDGKTYIAAVEEKDEQYYQLVLPDWWKFKTPADRQRGEAAVLHATANTKVAKVLFVDDTLWSTIELFLESPEQLAPVLERCLGALVSSVEHCIHELTGHAKGH